MFAIITGRITLSSILAKLLDRVIVGSNYHTLNYTSDLRLGFKPDSSPTQCSSVFKNVIIIITSVVATCSFFLDANEALDTVEYPRLFSI